ncbi:hypothetical protein [Sphingobacterium detergens]|uniref:Uncharacterized protein n=1 Tax=Sphingobacterium detergens TaxID=1145106 RepID=A0A420BKF2_SPHD1|nr:hypothetical protein [Sphingobacterium detergens]RKE57105.1 hypothetical protein DFQ12_1981 [Sphingobacterium detergens]
MNGTTLLFKSSLTNYVIALKSILYPFRTGSLLKEYSDRIPLEASHWKSSSGSYAVHVPNYIAMVHTVPQSGRQALHTEDRMSQQAGVTSESNLGQYTEHIVFLSSLCFLLIVTVIVLRNWYKIKVREHVKLQCDKAEFERQISL